MSKTEVSGKQVKDGTIELVDLSSSLQSSLSGKADTSSLAAVATSGAYADLTGKPSLFDGAYSSLTGAPSLAAVATSGAYADLTGKPSLATVATSGSYNDLLNKPTLGSLSGSIDDLSDVTITSAAANQYLRFNGSAWVNGALPVASGSTSGIVSGDFQIFSGEKRFSSGIQSSVITSNGTGATLSLVGVTGGTNIGASIALTGNSADGNISFATKNQQFVNPTIWATLNKDGLFSMLGGASISSGAAATKGLIVKGAASQSANLFEAQNSSGTALFSIDSAGSVSAGTVPVARVSGLATVATSGSYNDLSDKPSIPSIAGLATETYVDNAVAAVVNSAPAVLDTLNELAAALGDDPNFATTVAGQIGDVASDVSALDTRVTAVESDVAALQSAGAPNLSDLGEVSITSPSNGQVLKYNGTGWVNAADSTFSGSYNDLTDKPSLFDGAYSSLTGAPSLAAVATSGSYADLSNKPSIPSALDDLSDVAVTSASKGQFIVHNGTQFVNSNTIEASGAVVKPLIVKGAASQSANLLEVQNSSGTALTTIDSAGKLGIGVAPTTPLDILNGSATGYGEIIGIKVTNDHATYNAVGLALVAKTGKANNSLGFFVDSTIKSAIGYDRTGNYLGFVNNAYSSQEYGLRMLSTGALSFCDGANGTERFSITKDGITTIKSSAASSVALTIKAAAAQSNFIFEVQDNSATTLFTINSAGNASSKGTIHAARYTETVANAFNTSLAPSSGTLTVDTSVGNAVLGALNASVTTWAFTNVPTENSKVTTITAVIAGNASYTYGDACSVNGNAVTDGVRWSGGSAPTATANTDIITFIIVRDSAGTVRVFGSATTNFS